MIKRVTTLHALNNQFAIEHEKVQKQLLESQMRCEQYELEMQNGCDSCRTYAKNEVTHATERDSLAKENRQLRDDIKMMKTLIYRLNVQLERYQELLRKKTPELLGSMAAAATAAADLGGAPDNNGIPIHTTSASEHIYWGTVDSNALAPLLNAYQETINDKSELIQQYENELNLITGKIKDILAENEMLHQDMANLKRSNEHWLSDKTRMQAQLDIFRYNIRKYVCIVYSCDDCLKLVVINLQK